MQKELTIAEQIRQANAERSKTESVPFLLPDPKQSFTVMMTRVPIEAWIGTDLLPEGLLRDVVTIFSKETDKEKLEVGEELGEERTAKASQFLLDVVMKAITKPKLVLHVTDDPDELCLADLTSLNRGAIIAQQLLNVPNLRVRLENGGDVSLDALRLFSDEPTGSSVGADLRTLEFEPGDGVGDMPTGIGG